jgi:hypothetical protein
VTANLKPRAAHSSPSSAAFLASATLTRGLSVTPVTVPTKTAAARPNS